LNLKGDPKDYLKEREIQVIAERVRKELPVAFVVGETVGEIIGRTCFCLFHVDNRQTMQLNA